MWSERARALIESKPKPLRDELAAQRWRAEYVRRLSKATTIVGGMFKEGESVRLCSKCIGVLTTRHRIASASMTMEAPRGRCSVHHLGIYSWVLGPRLPDVPSTEGGS